MGKEYPSVVQSEVDRLGSKATIKKSELPGLVVAMANKDDAKAVRDLSAEVANLAYTAEEACAIYRDKIGPVREEGLKLLQEMRNLRMGLTTETAHIQSTMKETMSLIMRGFSDEQWKRLREFVDLCERLHALKHNGTMDAMIDIALRMPNNEGPKS